MSYLEAKAKWESVKDLRELNVFEYEIIITAFLKHIAQLEAAQQGVQSDWANVCPDCKQVSNMYRCESCGCQWSPRR